MPKFTRLLLQTDPNPTQGDVPSWAARGLAINRAKIIRPCPDAEARNHINDVHIIDNHDESVLSRVTQLSARRMYGTGRE